MGIPLIRIYAIKNSSVSTVRSAETDTRSKSTSDSGLRL